MKDKRLTHYHMDSTTTYKLNKLVDRKHFSIHILSIPLISKKQHAILNQKYSPSISERKIRKTHSKETESYVTLQFAFCEKAERMKLGGRREEED